MSRALIYDKLRLDEQLIAEGLGAVEANWASDESPTRKKPFFILRWGADNEPRFDRGNHTRDLTIWSHIPEEIGNDFGWADTLLVRAKDVLTAIELETGEDGYEVTEVRYQGGSGDLWDPGFRSYTRNALFTVLSHKAVSA